MFSDNNKISLRQLQVLLILDIFGIGVITLPRRTAEMAGQSGWLLIIGATAIVYFYSFLLSKISIQFPSLTFVELCEKILGKPMGIILCIGLGLKIFFITGLQIRIFCEILRQTMLFKTPIWITSIAMLLVCGFVAFKGYECRARTGEILIVIMFVPLIVVFGMACFDTDFTNLMPIFNIKGTTFIKGSLFTALSFQSLEFLLLVFPFIKKPEKIGKAVGQGVIAIGILMTLVTVITMARFGESDVKIKLWPVLQMMNTIDIPGSFIERQDVVIMRFWVISIFSAINAGIFLISILGSRMTGKDNSRKKIVLLSLPIIFIISMAPSNVASAYNLLDFFNLYFGIFYFVIVPISLFLVSKIRFRGGAKVEN